MDEPERHDVITEIREVEPPLPKLAAAKFLDAGFKPGEIIPHEWFYQALGLERPTKETPCGIADRVRVKFLGGFDAMKRILEDDYQIWLSNEFALGYKWVENHEVTRDGTDQGQQLVTRGISKMARAYMTVDVMALNDIQRKEHADAMAKLAKFKAMRRRIAKADDVKKLTDIG